jgi:uncharacterized phage infection (PIP) family protein YhgE
VSSSSSPAQPGRPTVPLSQAAKILGKDWRTVKRLVETGELEGGSTLVAKRRTYYVYADQLAQRGTGQGTDGDRELLETIAELRRELGQTRASEERARAAESRAQAAAAAAQETNRLLQANQAILLSAVKDFQGASDDTAGLVDDYRALTDRHWSISDKYRSSASNFAQAADNFQNILGRLLTPDDISTLISDDPTLD